MKLDPAIVQLLNLDASQTSVSLAGEGGCSAASTCKITTKSKDGAERTFFMKTSRGKAAEAMFAGEHASLTAIHNAVPSLCPQSYGHGQFKEQSDLSFLVTDFIHMTSRSSSKPSGVLSLAAKLAKLHITPAPTSDGYDTPMFGFPVTTCCGDTPQENSFKKSWAEFYAENRLMAILNQAETNNGKDKEVRNLVEATASRVTPRLLGDENLNNGKGVIPVVVHGDLWSGNAGVGIICKPGGDDVAQEYVYDSSVCYAHNEYELGIMKMFGGFGKAFLDEYHARCPKTEPKGEYDDRVELYQLYHVLNHYALFGGGYRGSAVKIMEKLVRKYG